MSGRVAFPSPTLTGVVVRTAVTCPLPGCRAHGRSAEPTAAVVDPYSVKTSANGKRGRDQPGHPAGGSKDAIGT